MPGKDPNYEPMILSDEIHIFVIHNFKKNTGALLEPRFLSILGQHTDLQRNQISKNSLGKPMIEGIHFSLAHSGDLLVAAFSDQEIGIDIEQVKERKYQKAIAQKYGFLGESLDEFLREWTAREAFIKLLGSSLAKDLANIRLSSDLSRVGINEPQAFVSYFQPRPGFIAAICSKQLKNHNIFFT